MRVVSAPSKHRNNSAKPWERLPGGVGARVAVANRHAMEQPDRAARQAHVHGHGGMPGQASIGAHYRNAAEDRGGLLSGTAAIEHLLDAAKVHGTRLAYGQVPLDDPVVDSGEATARPDHAGGYFNAFQGHRRFGVVVVQYQQHASSLDRGRDGDIVGIGPRCDT